MKRKLPSLRERQRLETRRLVQKHATRLFLARGYDETTVNDVAEAAGVSAMTVYRHFPTKEDLVLRDEYNEVVGERIAARPKSESLVQRIGRTLIEDIGPMVGGGAPGGKEVLLARLRLVMETPALRARQWEGQYAVQKAIVEALRDESNDADWEFRIWVASGACCAAMRAALMRWAEQDGRPDLSRLVTQALSIAFEGQFP